MEVATFAGGCFWRMQTIFSKVPGVLSTVVGFSGGFVPYPSYELVRTGTTGHAESIQITFNPYIVTYAKLLEIFFQAHDSSQLNRQGLDVGPQYRSVIFCHNSTQWQLASAYIQQLKMVRMLPVVTQVVPFQAFYPAEGYHQYYEARNLQTSMAFL